MKVFSSRYCCNVHVDHREFGRSPGGVRLCGDLGRPVGRRHRQPGGIDGRDECVAACPRDLLVLQHPPQLIAHLGGELCGLSHCGQHHRVGGDGDGRGQREPQTASVRAPRQPRRGGCHLHLSRGDPGHQPGRVHHGHRRVSRRPYELGPRSPPVRTHWWRSPSAVTYRPPQPWPWPGVTVTVVGSRGSGAGGSVVTVPTSVRPESGRCHGRDDQEQSLTFQSRCNLDFSRERSSTHSPPSRTRITEAPRPAGPSKQSTVVPAPITGSRDVLSTLRTAADQLDRPCAPSEVHGLKLWQRSSHLPMPAVRGLCRPRLGPPRSTSPLAYVPEHRGTQQPLRKVWSHRAIRPPPA